MPITRPPSAHLSPSETPRDFHFIGTLADALNVDAKWERAVEGVLGSLQSIVVPTPDDAVARLSGCARTTAAARVFSLPVCTAAVKK